MSEFQVSESKFASPASPDELELAEVSVLVEEAGLTNFHVKKEMVALGDKARSLIAKISMSDFLDYLKARAAAVFLAKLEVTETDFCTWVIPNCSRKEGDRLFEFFWPIIESTTKGWISKIFDPASTYQWASI